MRRFRISVLLATLALGANAWAQAPARRPVRRGPARPGGAATPTQSSGDAGAASSDAAAEPSAASTSSDAGAASGDASAGASPTAPGGVAGAGDADAGPGAQSGDAGIPAPPGGETGAGSAGQIAAPPGSDSAPPSSQTSGRMLVALIDTAPVGVDPAAAGIVTDNVRQLLESLGYATVPTQTLYAAARALHLPFPVPPTGIEALLHALDAPVAVSVELQGGGGYYQPTIRVRFAAEPVERYRRLVATQFTLLDSIRGTLPAMLAPPAPPGTVSGPGAYPYPPGAPGLPPPGGVGYVPPPQRRRRPTRIHPNPWDLALDAEVAIGPGSGSDFFVNFLAGARVAYFPVDRFGLTLGISYANLRGRERNAVTGMNEDVRRSNVLPMLGVETGIDVAPRQHIYLPLRAEVGYLPYNGPVLRLTGALAVPITRDTRVEFDILTPTFWWVPGATLVTLDMGVQLVIGFGRPPPRHHRRTAPATTQNESTGSAQPASTSTAPAASTPAREEDEPATPSSQPGAP